MEENKSLKEEVQKSLNDLNEVKACFAVFTDGIKNNVCVGGFGNDIINSLANMYMESPETLKLIEAAVTNYILKERGIDCSKEFDDRVYNYIVEQNRKGE